MNEDTIELLLQFLSAMAGSSFEFNLRVRVLDRMAREHPEALPDYEKLLAEGRANLGVQRSRDGILEVLDSLRAALRRE